MRQNKRHNIIALAILAFAILLVGCGPVTNAQGTTVPYDVWLANAEATDMELTKWAYYGTPTFTPTPTLTPTPTTTATMTPTPTITPSPTPTPFNGFLLVNNQTGDRIKTAEFMPDCGGNWGMPGVDVWIVEKDNPIQKICSTPWNRPQNLALSFILWAIVFLLGFVAVMIIGNEIRKSRNAQKRKAMMQSYQPALPMIPTQEDPILVFIRQIGQIDNGLAIRLHMLRRRTEFSALQTVGAFSHAVRELDAEFHGKIQAALERAALKDKEIQS